MTNAVAITGGGGFLGWHTRAALIETATPTRLIGVGSKFRLDEAVCALNGSSRLIHLAGVNRAKEEDVREGNVRFAQEIAGALRLTDKAPPIVVFANSIQAGTSSTYGASKARASDILAAAADDVGAEFVDLLLPNLFGEHGRPFYNAVTATFCYLLAAGETPTVIEDKPLRLLHAQDAADLLLGEVPVSDMNFLQEHETVSGVLRRLSVFAQQYRGGEIPDISERFDRNLFNTYRSYTVGSHTPIALMRHADERGSFFEIVRNHGGTSQSSFSTTAPGVSRGDHFHRRKVERFTVLAGQARISMRRIFTDEVLHFDVTGDKPSAVDMPTMWAHRITNTGKGNLYTSFWTDDLFNPSAPDTISEVV